MLVVEVASILSKFLLTRSLYYIVRNYVWSELDKLYISITYCRLGNHIACTTIVLPSHCKNWNWQLDRERMPVYTYASLNYICLLLQLQVCCDSISLHLFYITCKHNHTNTNSQLELLVKQFINHIGLDIIID